MLTFEWSYSIDQNPQRLRRVVEKLKQQFSQVIHSKSILKRPKRDGKYVRLHHRDALVTCTR